MRVRDDVLLKALHAHFQEEAYFSQTRQALGIVHIALVRCHVEGSSGVACIDANRRQAFCSKGMEKHTDSGPVSNMIRWAGRARLPTRSADNVGSDAKLPRQIRLPSRRIETAVSSIDTSNPICSPMFVLG